MSEWQPIETAPEGEDILVCVTHNLPDDEWETIQWVDYHLGGNWIHWRNRIDIPATPSRWMPLPAPPVSA